MAPSPKIASLVAAVVLLLVATPSEARGWAPEEGDQVSDMVVPVRTPAEQALVPIPGGAGMMDSICVECCCPTSIPGNCQKMACCATRNCNGAGTCYIRKDCSSRCVGAN